MPKCRISARQDIVQTAAILGAVSSLLYASVCILHPPSLWWTTSTPRISSCTRKKDNTWPTLPIVRNFSWLTLGRRGSWRRVHRKMKLLYFMLSILMKGLLYYELGSRIWKIPSSEHWRLAIHYAEIIRLMMGVVSFSYFSTVEGGIFDVGLEEAEHACSSTKKKAPIKREATFTKKTSTLSYTLSLLYIEM